MRTVFIPKAEYFPLYETGMFSDNKETSNGGYYKKQNVDQSQTAAEFAEMLKNELKFVASS